MNNFASIDWYELQLQLTINIVGNGMVEVKDRSRTVVNGNAEYCFNEIRNFMVFFDAGNKKVKFDIYDSTGGTPEGVKAKIYLRDKLTLMKSSCRAQVDVVAHMNSYWA